MKKHGVGHWKVVPVFAALLIVGACDQSGPEALLGPETVTTLSPELGPSLGKSKKDDKKDEKEKKDKKKGPKVKGKKKNGEEKELHAAVRTRLAKTDKVTMEVEPGDGPQVLQFAGHTLTVTGASVEKRTKFSLSEAHHFVDGEYVVAIELKATAGRGKDNNVGEAGFLAPVELCISSADVEGFDLEGEHDLVWFKPSGDEVDVVDGYVKGDQVCGELDHFSLWGLAWP